MRHPDDCDNASLHHFASTPFQATGESVAAMARELIRRRASEEATQIALANCALPRGIVLDTSDPDRYLLGMMASNLVVQMYGVGGDEAQLGNFAVAVRQARAILAEIDRG